MGGVLSDSLTINDIPPSPSTDLIKSALEILLEKLKKLVRLTLSFMQTLITD
jgi:hypothetical protein